MKKKWDLFKSYLLANPFRTAIGFIVSSWAVIAVLIWYAEKGAEGHNINNLEDAFWWGIVTLSTVGYGDRYPVTTLGRFWAGLLIAAGVVGIAVVTAKISSFFLERALRERSGFMDTSQLKDHFIICGWKPEMGRFLLYILDSNKTLKDSDIVLVNGAPEGDIEALRSIPRLRNIKVVRGEHYNEENLRRAAPERAIKILIMADATPNAAGQIPTITEADARTVITAMTLNHIVRGVPVAAEILDASMDQYLRLAHVNEILYSRDYSRFLLAMSSTGTGVTNVLHDLLDPKSPAFMATQDIPVEFLDKDYEELQAYFHKEKRELVLVGILENSGNSFAAKEKALKRALQTPNVTELVQNLQSVKALRFNRPVFNPRPDYMVREGSMAIVIEHRGELHG